MINCTPGRIRTPNPLVRSQVLYPIKPRAHSFVIIPPVTYNRWGAGIRTPTGGTRIRCPAIRRRPNVVITKKRRGKFMPPTMKSENVFRLLFN